MNTWNKIFIFAAGAAVGSIVTWKVLKTKYEQIEEYVDEEYDEYSEDDEIEDSSEDENALPSTEDLHRLKHILETNRYTNYSNKKEEKEEENVDEDRPYVISPEEFDDNDEYDTVSLTLYADGVLTDERDNIIEDVDGMVGEDSLNHFGEYEEDSVFVRNDALQTDFEILKDMRSFKEVYPDN